MALALVVATAGGDAAAAGSGYEEAWGGAYGAGHDVVVDGDA